MAETIRVYLVDDSLVARLVLEDLLTAEGLEVVGTAASGAKALREIPRLRPDVVLMDVLMPTMDGLECARRLMAIHATPILVVSDLVGARSDLNFEVLKAGALDVCRKPTRKELDDGTVRARLVRQVRLLAGVPVVTRRPHLQTRPLPGPPSAPPVRARGPAGSPTALFIGTSTGGPLALRDILAGLHQTGNSGPPIVIVQHMVRGFLAGLASWLTQTTGYEVELVGPTTHLHPGRVLLAPDDRNVELDGSRLRLVDPSPGSPQPSIDALFRSVAGQPDADRMGAILLTGMGRDGAQGLHALHHMGAWTIAQDEATSVVWGMPRAAIELGAAQEILSLPEIRARIHYWWRAASRS